MTFNEIINNIIDKIKGYSQKNAIPIDTRVGTVLRDFIIAPICYVIEDIYKNIDTKLSSNSILTATGSDLDNIASSYGFYRLQGKKARGICRFYKKIDNLSISSVDILYGTSVYGYNKEFVTLSNATISLTSLIETNINSPFYGYRYVDVQVEAVEVGSSYNLSAFGINTVLSQGIDGVANLSDITGGADIETDDSLRTRVLTWLGGNYGTISGYKNDIISNFNVDDISIITKNDSEFFKSRLSAIGAFDIVIKTNQTSVMSENLNVTLDNNGNNIVFLGYKPVKRIISIMDANNNQIVNYTLKNILEYGDFYYNSSNNGFVVDIGNYSTSKVYVTYEYYNQISEINDYINSIDKKIINTNPLVRKSEEVNIFITMKVKKLPGYYFLNIESNIKNALINMINSKKIGSTLQRSDIISVSYVDGVDYINLSDGFLVTYIRKSVSDDQIALIETLNLNKYESFNISESNILIIEET